MIIVSDLSESKCVQTFLKRKEICLSWVRAAINGLVLLIFESEHALSNRYVSLVIEKTLRNVHDRISSSLESSLCLSVRSGKTT